MDAGERSVKVAGMVLTLWAVLLGAAGGAGPLVIAETLSPPDMVGLGARMSRSVEAEARQQRLTVIGPQQLRRTLDDAQLEALAACKLDSYCATPLLQATGATRAVLASLERDRAHYLVRLALIDLRTGERIAQVQRAVLIASRRLDRDVQAALPGLLRGEQEATGELVLEASVPGVQITVDDVPSGTTPLSLTLKPGRHRILAEVAGHYPVERFVDVDAGGRHAETLRMTAHSLADAGPVDEPAVTAERTEAAQRASSSRLEAAGVLGGTALVALATTAGLHAAAIKDGQRPEGASTLRGARNVALGVGAASALAAGALWLWESTSSAPPPIAISPLMSGTELGFAIGGRFD